MLLCILKKLHYIQTFFADLTSICSTYGGSLLQKAPVDFRPSLEELLHDAPPDGVDLVCKLLVFNPHKRLTAAQALEHSYVQR